jgi:hypothetical protein
MSERDKKWINLGTKLESITAWMGGFFSDESNLLNPTVANTSCNSSVEDIKARSLAKSFN